MGPGNNTAARGIEKKDIRRAPGPASSPQQEAAEKPQVARSAVPENAGRSMGTSQPWDIRLAVVAWRQADQEAAGRIAADLNPVVDAIASGVKLTKADAARFGKPLDVFQTWLTRTIQSQQGGPGVTIVVLSAAKQGALSCQKPGCLPPDCFCFDLLPLDVKPLQTFDDSGDLDFSPGGLGGSGGGSGGSGGSGGGGSGGGGGSAGSGGGASGRSGSSGSSGGSAGPGGGRLSNPSLPLPKPGPTRIIPRPARPSTGNSSGPATGPAPAPVRLVVVINGQELEQQQLQQLARESLAELRGAPAGARVTIKLPSSPRIVSQKPSK